MFPILQTSCVDFVCFANSTHCTTDCKVALVLQIPYLLSLLLHSFPCCYHTLMKLVIAFLAYCWCNYRIICMYGLHGVLVSVHLTYSTVCTMVGVSLPYLVHVLTP